MNSMSKTTKLLGIRISQENALYLYNLADREHRGYGQQLDLIIQAYMETNPVVRSVDGRFPAAVNGNK